MNPDSNWYQVVGRLATKIRGIEPGHDLEHALRVSDHCRQALLGTDQGLSPQQKDAVVYAGLLHDADDHKFFPENRNFDNARDLVVYSGLPYELWVPVIDMIRLVSYSSNGDSQTLPGGSEPVPVWMLIPRWADRLEACGPTGLERCRSFAKHVSHVPEIHPDTPRLHTPEEIYREADRRAGRYVGSGRSRSVVDHYYDKIIPMGRGLLNVPVPYLARAFQENHEYDLGYVSCMGRSE